MRPVKRKKKKNGKNDGKVYWIARGQEDLEPSHLYSVSLPLEGGGRKGGRGKQVRQAD